MTRSLTSLFILLLAFVGPASAQQEQFVTRENIEDDLKSFVCKNNERLYAVKTLFKNAGAKDADLNVVTSGKVNNLVVTHRGESDDIIVVGAHYDKVSAGCGVIDNWSGVVIIANLYRYLSHFKTKKTILIVAFDREEEGLVGSNAFAGSIPKEKKGQYCSMINFDSFGFGYPQVMKNASTPSLEEFAKKLASDVKMPYHDAVILGADADSNSFRAKGIPAITLHGLSNDWQRYLHSSSDNIKNLNVSSVYVAFNFGALLLSNLDSQACDAFWPKAEKKKGGK